MGENLRRREPGAGSGALMVRGPDYSWRMAGSFGRRAGHPRGPGGQGDGRPAPERAPRRSRVADDGRTRSRRPLPRRAATTSRRSSSPATSGSPNSRPRKWSPPSNAPGSCGARRTRATAAPRVLLLTDEGRAKLEAGHRRWKQLEDEWAALVGRDRLDVVRAALESYVAADRAARDRGAPADGSAVDC